MLTGRSFFIFHLLFKLTNLNLLNREVIHLYHLMVILHHNCLFIRILKPNHASLVNFLSYSYTIQQIYNIIALLFCHPKYL